MRPLIRPFLFMLARLGLFLAVVAWAVGQGRTVSLALGYIGLGLNGYSWMANWDTSAHGFDASVETGAEAECITGLGQSSFRQLERFPGIAMQWHRFPWLMVKHWLIVTAVIVFNLFLHFIYRKRPESQPCED